MLGKCLAWHVHERRATNEMERFLLHFQKMLTSEDGEKQLINYDCEPVDGCRERCLWPSNAFRFINDLFVYLLNHLHRKIDVSGCV